MIRNPFRHDADNSQTMTNTHKPYSPSPEYRHFLYDPNDGHTFYSTPEERDIAAKNLIKDYLVDGEWSEQVVDIYAGEATHLVSEIERIDKAGELDEDGYDENGEYWVNNDVDCKCNYGLRPLVPTPPVEVEDLATSLQNCGTWLIEIGYASEQVNTRDLGIGVARAAEVIRQQAAVIQQQAEELAVLGRPSQPPAKAEQDELVAWLSNPLNHLRAAILIRQQAELLQEQDAELKAPRLLEPTPPAEGEVTDNGKI